ncbi:hypothetical protein TthTF19_23420 (plasmid) [Thermus thermophilus]|uniref:hypothetical protein n=1 Tax=Thermus thermophilus TaxID=274 RepID=UPI0030DE89EC
MEAVRASWATPFQAWVRVLLPDLGILAGSAMLCAACPPPMWPKAVPPAGYSSVRSRY